MYVRLYRESDDSIGTGDLSGTVTSRERTTTK